MTDSLFFYDSAIIITAAVLACLCIFLCGFMLRWKRKAYYWRALYYDSIEPVVPPTIEADPYDGVKTALEYNWGEDWD